MNNDVLRRHGVAPVAVLIFLAPVMAELLTGILPVSKLWLLIPEMGVYGVGALLIREVTRRRGNGWGMILLLGVAFSIAEECVILQTSLTPQFSNFSQNFGWVGGVEWNYLTAMLWYESVYAIVLPIYLTEILYPDVRETPWLSQRGLITACAIFVLASIGVWLLWTRVGLLSFASSSYQVPLLYVGIALVVIVIIIALALSLKPRTAPPQPVNRRAVRPWVVGVLSFLFDITWFVVIITGFVPAEAVHGASPLIVIVGAAIWAGIALLTVRWLSSAQGWSDQHRLALIFGANLAAMLGGVLVVARAEPIDKIGKLVFDLIAIGLFVVLTWRVRHRQPQEVSAG